MRTKNVVMVTALAVVLAVAVLGTVAYGVYAGFQVGQGKPLGHAGVISGHAPGILASENVATSSAAAPANGRAPQADLAIAAPAPGVFSPGSPPFGGTGAAGADGISAWGVAYREVSDPNAQVDSELVRAAYQDAEKKAAELATATGNKLGKLVALTDYSHNQPYYKPCVQNYAPPGGPVPQGKPEPGGTGSAVAPLPPFPCQANSNHYLVAWVYVRHAL